MNDITKRLGDYILEDMISRDLHKTIGFYENLSLYDYLIKYLEGMDVEKVIQITNLLEVANQTPLVQEVAQKYRNMTDTLYKDKYSNHLDLMVNLSLTKKEK